MRYVICCAVSLFIGYAFGAGTRAAERDVSRRAPTVASLSEAPSLAVQDDVAIPHAGDESDRVAVPPRGPEVRAQGDRIGALVAALEAVTGYRGATAETLEEYASRSSDPGLSAMGFELELERLTPTEGRSYALDRIRIEGWIRDKLVAAKYLARSGDPDTLAELARMAEDEDPARSWAPAVALALTGDDAPLWRWADSVALSCAQASPTHPWSELSDLVTMAALWEHQATLSVLGMFAKHHDELVRREVFEQLTRHRSRQADVILKGFAQDASDDIREMACPLTGDDAAAR